jgi:hypothetical protein
MIKAHSSSQCASQHHFIPELIALTWYLPADLNRRVKRTCQAVRALFYLLGPKSVGALGAKAASVEVGVTWEEAVTWAAAVANLAVWVAAGEAAWMEAAWMAAATLAVPAAD